MLSAGHRFRRSGSPVAATRFAVESLLQAEIVLETMATNRHQKPACALLARDFYSVDQAPPAAPPSFGVRYRTAPGVLGRREDSFIDNKRLIGFVSQKPSSTESRPSRHTMPIANINGGHFVPADCEFDADLPVQPLLKVEQTSSCHYIAIRYNGGSTIYLLGRRLSCRAFILTKLYSALES